MYCYFFEWLFVILVGTTFYKSFYCQNGYLVNGFEWSRGKITSGDVECSSMAMWESIWWILLQITCALPFSIVCTSQVLYGILVFYTERYPKRPITSKNKQNSTAVFHDTSNRKRSWETRIASKNKQNRDGGVGSEVKKILVYDFLCVRVFYLYLCFIR